MTLNDSQWKVSEKRDCSRLINHQKWKPMDNQVDCVKPLDQMLALCSIIPDMLLTWANSLLAKSVTKNNIFEC